MKGLINKIKIPYYKTDKELPYHKGIEPVCCTEERKEKNIYGKFKIYPSKRKKSKIYSLEMSCNHGKFYSYKI